jgi:hypothetical protein
VENQSYREKWFFHHRSLGTAERSGLASGFAWREGLLFGGIRSGTVSGPHTMTKKPYVIGGVVLGMAMFTFLHRTPRPVSDELMKFHEVSRW